MFNHKILIRLLIVGLMLSLVVSTMTQDDEDDIKLTEDYVLPLVFDNSLVLSYPEEWVTRELTRQSTLLITNNPDLLENSLSSISSGDIYVSIGVTTPVTNYRLPLNGDAVETLNSFGEQFNINFDAGFEAELVDIGNHAVATGDLIVSELVYAVRMYGLYIDEIYIQIDFLTLPEEINDYNNLKQAIVASVDLISQTDSSSDISIVTYFPESADPERGEELFNTFMPEYGFSCATCHLVDTTDSLIGPGLLNVAEHAENSRDGQDVLVYLYQSITDPDAYIVEDYIAGLMPTNAQEVFNNDDIIDLIAYLTTLYEPEPEVVNDYSDFVFPSDLPESADPVRGEALFNGRADDVSVICMACHDSNSGGIIAPDLTNIATIAETRISGQTVVEYLYESIADPDAYVVAGYSEGLMTPMVNDLSEDDIYNLIAYILTLGE